MEKKFKVSVIVPIYNVEEYLDECLKSVVNQTIGFKENVQLILVNDGSPDNSERICLKYKERYPENIVYIKQENAGVSAARNNGLKHAEGEYVNFLDSDDKWELTAFENGCNILDKHKDVDFASFRVRFFDLRNNYHIQDFKFKSEKEVVDVNEDPNYIQSIIAAIFFRREAIANHFFDLKLKYAEDVKYINTLLLNKMKYGLVNNSCYFYRKRQDESSATQSGSRHKYYYDSLNKSYVFLMDYVKEKVGYIPLYFQYLTMYELQWRLKHGIKIVLSDEERKDYINTLKYLLKNIDDQVIFDQKNISFNYKLLAISLKYGKNLGKRIKIVDDEIVLNKASLGSFDKLLNCITEFELRGNKLLIIGNLTFVGQFKLFYKLNGKMKQLNTYSRLDVDKTFGINAIRLGYNETINLSSCGTLEFFIELDGKKYKLKNSITHYSRLNNLRTSYYYENKYLITHTKDGMTIKYKKKPCKVGLLFREILYLSQLVLVKKKTKVALTRLLYWLTKPFIRKDIYLFCDREFMAGDSGEILFKYFNEHNKDKKIKCYFVVDKNYADYERMKKYGKVVSYHSMKYKLLFLNAKFVISSHADGYVNNAFGKSRWFYIDLFRFKYVYLTHGILLHDSSKWLNRINKNFALNVVTSPMEYDSIINGPYYFEKGQLIKTGMPRYDNLMNLKIKEENKILFMPSWRQSLVAKIIPGTQRREYNPEFKNSEYFLFYKKLFSDERLLSVLREKDLKVKFCIHPSFRAQVDDFVGNDCVEFAIDVNSQYETLSSKCIITDYSSAACDFAYLNKPVIYANFDYDHIYEVHYYNKGYFDYDKHGFGPNCSNYEETLSEILKVINNDFKVEKKYENRMKKFFFYRDNKNSQRVYNEILKLAKTSKKEKDSVK